MKKSDMLQKRCVPCHGGVSPLDPAVVKQLLQELNSGWQLNAAGHLYKKYIFKNFIQAMAWANAITTRAEEEGHHPQLTIGWGLCGVELWTHAVKGLTENDFIMAAKIDALAPGKPEAA